ncbi:MAG TPA: hypothetical protein VN817_05385 [Solirubrobacteraceae bacterium]|nr:hypothetical protein [Solirubrobacteraceae bacterium]
MSSTAQHARARRRPVWPTLLAVLLSATVMLTLAPPVAVAAVVPSTSHAAGGEQAPSSSESTVSSLEAAASKAGDTGRAVAMSLIGLAFAVAATVLAFRRDFKEAAGVFAVGIVSVLLATPAGVSLLRDTVASLFGSQ